MLITMCTGFISIIPQESTKSGQYHIQLNIRNALGPLIRILNEFHYNWFCNCLSNHGHQFQKWVFRKNELNVLCYNYSSILIIFYIFRIIYYSTIHPPHSVDKTSKTVTYKKSIFRKSVLDITPNNTITAMWSKWSKPKNYFNSYT